MKKMNEKYEKELSMLSDLMGLEEKLKIEEIGHIMDSVECSLANGKSETLPKELRSGDFLKTMQYLRNLQILTKFTDLEKQRREEVSRLMGGHLLSDILKK